MRGSFLALHHENIVSFLELKLLTKWALLPRLEHSQFLTLKPYLHLASAIHKRYPSRVTVSSCCLYLLCHVSSSQLTPLSCLSRFRGDWFVLQPLLSESYKKTEFIFSSSASSCNFQNDSFNPLNMLMPKPETNFIYFVA